ncbi:hypothetical protein ACQ86N_02455 [Puia sp. P3]|uniref:hypothetical protein n=1 Tax=Puia sp. P3 TaxID=3423952 RepID=UPI003D675A24
MVQYQSILLSSRYGQGLLAGLRHEHPTFFAGLVGNNGITDFKIKHMNENNLSFLQRQLENTGYGKEHHKELREAIVKQNPAFTLFHQQDYGKDSTVSSLHFKKAENSDMYFFNNHTVILKNERHPDPIRQTFYVNSKGDNITLKEGYNLLSGRAVEKDLENRER